MTFGDTTMLRRWKHVVFLALLLAGVVVQSFATATSAKSNLHSVTETVFTVSIFLVVFERSAAAVRRVMTVLLILIVSFGWARYLPVSSFERALLVTHEVGMAIFCWVTVWMILRIIFRTSVIGADNVLGAICGYLVAGQAWASLNALAYLLAPATYLFDPTLDPLLADWHGRHALFAYYSYTQMLTIGYADVTPLKAPATTLSLLATFFGVFYTAVIVSTLVSMAQSTRKGAPGDQ